MQSCVATDRDDLLRPRLGYGAQHLCVKEGSGWVKSMCLFVSCGAVLLAWELNRTGEARWRQEMAADSGLVR